MTPEISINCGQVTVGLKKIEYLLLEDVPAGDLFTIVNTTWRRVTQPGEGVVLWQQLPVLPTPTWTESSTKSAQGTRYSEQVAARVPQLSPLTSSVMDTLSRKPMLVRITTSNNFVYLLGNYEQTMTLSFQRSQGGGGQFGGYTVSIVGDMSHAATL